MRDYRFGDFLHELRTRTGLTQHQLGALVGVSDKAVSKWENGTSKPKSDILYKLSEILGVSADELLSCKYHAFEKKEGVFVMKKELWKQAMCAMHERYGEPVPIEIVNRFLSEQAEMQNTDMIVYFALLATLAREAKERREHICVRGGTGASFVAYLLGATEINPLPPHYACPACGAVVFDDIDVAGDGWDLPEKLCTCGKRMRSDGHGLPFEVYRHTMHRHTSFLVSVSPSFLDAARSVAEAYFKDHKLTVTQQEAERIVTVTVSSDRAACAFTFCAEEELARRQAIERATGIPFDEAPFCHGEVLRAFQNGDTDGIPEFESTFVTDMLRTVCPKDFCQLIQIPGFSHGAGVWKDNADKHVAQGICAGNLIAYRDDVFNGIQKKMSGKGQTDTGFAYSVMEAARRGVYAKNGVPQDVASNLKAIGIEDRFIDSIGKIGYLFPKAHGVACVQAAATWMWYKLQYPTEFREVFC